MDLKKKIRVIDGWPRNGVKFQDITPLMQDPKAFSFLCQQLVRRYEGEEINKGTNEELDKLIGKPFNEERNDKCNSFIYDLIPGSKDQIEKLRGTLE